MGYTLEKWCQKCGVNHNYTKKYWYVPKNGYPRCKAHQKRCAAAKRRGDSLPTDKLVAQSPMGKVSKIRSKIKCQTCGETGSPEQRDVYPHVGIYCRSCGAWMQWLKQVEKVDNIASALSPRKAAFRKTHVANGPGIQPRTDSKLQVDADGFIIG